MPWYEPELQLAEIAKGCIEPDHKRITYTKLKKKKKKKKKTKKKKNK